MDIRKRQLSALIVHAVTQARQRERLAWRTTNQHIRSDHFIHVDVVFYLCHVAKIFNIRVVMSEYLTREFLDLRKPRSLPA